MIVRILNEGQYRIDDSHLGELNECDDAIERAVDSNDQDRLTAALNTLITKIGEIGEVLPDDDLHDSDLIVPDAESTIEEIRVWLDDSGSDEGLIPG
ncbi:PspA-associated protein PspAA [Mariniluteicoccus flavus]